MVKKSVNHTPGDEGENSDILIAVLLDRSGSMEGKESDVIGQYNSFIRDQKAVPGKALVSLVLFDDYYEEVYIGKDIREIPKLTAKTYYTRGSTALLDALGKLIQSVDAITNKPEKVMFLINTDGYENASREFTKAKIKDIVQERQNNHGWEFLFIGAGVDAFTDASGIGLRGGQTFTASATMAGFSNISAYSSGYTTNYRTTGARGQALTNATMDSVADVLVDEPIAVAASPATVTVNSIKAAKKKKSTTNTNTTGSNGSI